MGVGVCVCVSVLGRRQRQAREKYIEFEFHSWKNPHIAVYMHMYVRMYVCMPVSVSVCVLLAHALELKRRHTHTYTTKFHSQKGAIARGSGGRGRCRNIQPGDCVGCPNKPTDTAASGTSFVLALPAAATTVYVGLLLAALKTPTHTLIHTHAHHWEAHMGALRERDSTIRLHNARKQLRTKLPHTRTQQ